MYGQQKHIHVEAREPPVAQDTRELDEAFDDEVGEAASASRGINGSGHLRGMEAEKLGSIQLDGKGSKGTGG